jgi:hypothetical protein
MPIELDLVDGTGIPYWKEVSKEKFQNRFDELFCKEYKPHPPRISVEKKCIMISQDTQIYSDFLIDFSKDSPTFYLHNYSFAV